LIWCSRCGFGAGRASSAGCGEKILGGGAARAMNGYYIADAARPHSMNITKELPYSRKAGMSNANLTRQPAKVRALARFAFCRNLF
jgi:hypothetical protein